MTHTPIDNVTLEAMVKAANEAAAGHPVDEYYLVSPRMMEAALAAATPLIKAAKERETTNPCNKIFDHKWLSPECVETGCKSLLLARRAERAEELADKYKWQVRDTCTRAEKAEAALAEAAKERDAALASLRALLAKARKGLLAMITEWDKLTRYGSPLAKAANENLQCARASLASLDLALREIPTSDAKPLDSP